MSTYGFEDVTAEDWQQTDPLSEQTQQMVEAAQRMLGETEQDLPGWVPGEVVRREISAEPAVQRDDSTHGGVEGLSEGQSYAVGGKKDFFADNDVPRVVIPPPTDQFAAAGRPVLGQTQVPNSFIAEQTQRHAASEYPDRPVLTDQGTFAYRQGTAVESTETTPVPETAPREAEQVEEKRTEPPREPQEPEVVQKEFTLQPTDQNPSFLGKTTSASGDWLLSWWNANLDFAKAKNKDLQPAYVEKPPKVKWYKKIGAVARYGASQTGAHISYAARSVAQGARTLTRGLYLPVIAGVEVAAIEHASDTEGLLPVAIVVMSTLLLRESVASVNEFRPKSESKSNATPKNTEQMVSPTIEYKDDSTEHDTAEAEDYSAPAGASMPASV